MNIQLVQTFLLQTTPTALGSMAVLPMGEKKIQKVAVGDSSGVVQCFSLKKGSFSSAFKTLPNNQKVSSVTLGRAEKQKDRIIVATGESCISMCPMLGSHTFIVACRCFRHRDDFVQCGALCDPLRWCCCALSDGQNGTGAGVAGNPTLLQIISMLPAVVFGCLS